MKLHYRPEIDGLRALAVISVIIYHAQISFNEYKIFKGGFIGVDIFFVISGYLITSIIFKELITTGTFSFKYFYERRIRRILPALLFVMFVSIPFAWIYLVPTSLIDFSKSILYSLGFGSNYYFWYSGQDYGADSGWLKPFLHTWSLSVEEQYYILFPIILLLISKYLRQYLFPTFIFGFIICLILAEWGSRNYPSFNFYSLPTRGWELLAGSILAYFEIIRGYRNKQKLMNSILPSIGILMIAHSIFYFDDSMFHPSFYTLSPIIGVCLIIWFSDKDELITKILSSKIFVGVGLISYSLYLWHYPILSFARITEFTQGSFSKLLLILIIVLALSILSYFFIEKPARNKKFKFKIIFTSIIFLYIFLISTNYLILKKIPNYFEENLVTNFRTNLKTSLKNTNCQEIQKDYLKCSLNFKKNNQKIFLIGDSHIGSIRTDLKNRLIKKDYEVNIITDNLCMFFKNFYLIDRKTKKKNKCKFYNLIDQVFEENNSIFVIGGRFQMHMHESYFDNTEGGIEDGDFNAEYVSDGTFNSLKESFSGTLKKLQKRNSNNNIILIYPIPEIGWNVRQKLINSSPKKFSLSKDYYIPKEWITTSYDVYKKRSQSSFEVLDAIKGDNVYRIYPHKLFCNTKIKNRCITHDDKNIFYSDDNHPSLIGAQMINDLILDEIQKIK